MSLAVSEWRADAACLGTDPALWFPKHAAGPPAQARALRITRAICGRCPVREECLAEALNREREADAGIWAGTTPMERARLRGPDYGITWE